RLDVQYDEGRDGRHRCGKPRQRRKQQGEHVECDREWQEVGRRVQSGCRAVGNYANLEIARGHRPRLQLFWMRFAQHFKRYCRVILNVPFTAPETHVPEIERLYKPMFSTFPSAT